MIWWRNPSGHASSTVGRSTSRATSRPGLAARGDEQGAGTAVPVAQLWRTAAMAWPGARATAWGERDLAGGAAGASLGTGARHRGCTAMALLRAMARASGKRLCQVAARTSGLRQAAACGPRAGHAQLRQAVG